MDQPTVPRGLVWASADKAGDCDSEVINTAVNAHLGRIATMLRVIDHDINSGGESKEW